MGELGCATNVDCTRSAGTLECPAINPIAGIRNFKVSCHHLTLYAGTSHDQMQNSSLYVTVCSENNFLRGECCKCSSQQLLCIDCIELTSREWRIGKHSPSSRLLSRFHVLYLGNSRVYAQANCLRSLWVSLPERQTNKQATVWLYPTHAIQGLFMSWWYLTSSPLIRRGSACF